MARPPKVPAPTGSRGCPRCKDVLPIIDEATRTSNFAVSGYCRKCAREISAAYRATKKATEGAIISSMPAGEPGRPSVDELWLENRTQKVREAHITDFPAISITLSRCSCCHRAPTQTVRDLPFCDRCAYYVAASGRCAEHSFREFVPELLGRKDPPLLPFVPVEREWVRPRGAGSPGLDETDVPKDTMVNGR